MLPFILVGDLHSKERFPYVEATQRFFDWSAEKYKNHILIQLGDLYDSATVSNDVVHSVMLWLQQFHEVHIVEGNHDRSRAKSSALIPLTNLDNVHIYREPTEVVIEGIKCLFLPYGTKEYSGSYDYVFSHLAPKEDSFGGSFFDFSGLKAKRIYNGHIHLNKEYNSETTPNVYSLSVPCPTRNLETAGVVVELADGKETIIQVPDLFRIETIPYTTDPQDLDHNFLYNIIGAPSYDAVHEKFKGYYIREEGIVLESTPNVEILINSKVQSFADYWSEFCKENDLSKEIATCGIDYINQGA